MQFGIVTSSGELDYSFKENKNEKYFQYNVIFKFI